MSDQPRDRYAEVGEAMRVTLAAATRAEPKLGINDWRVLSAVLFHTASWSRLEDDTTINQVAIAAFDGALDDAGITDGWRRRRAAESLNTLARAGVITYRARKGPGARVRIGLVGRRPDLAESHPETRYDAELAHPEPHPVSGSHPDRGSHLDPGGDSIGSHPETGSHSNGHTPEWHPDPARVAPGSGANGTPIQSQSHPESAAHREVLPRTLTERATSEGPESHLEAGSHPDPGTDLESHPENGSHPDPGPDSVAFFAHARALARGDDVEPVEAVG